MARIHQLSSTRFYECDNERCQLKMAASSKKGSDCMEVTMVSDEEPDLCRQFFDVQEGRIVSSKCPPKPDWSLCKKEASSEFLVQTSKDKFVKHLGGSDFQVTKESEADVFRLVNRQGNSVPMWGPGHGALRLQLVRLPNVFLGFTVPKGRNTVYISKFAICSVPEAPGDLDSRCLMMNRSAGDHPPPLPCTCWKGPSCPSNNKCIQ